MERYSIFGCEVQNRVNLVTNKHQNGPEIKNMYIYIYISDENK